MADSKVGINGFSEEFLQRIERYKEMAPQNKRRASLGVSINLWEKPSPSFFGDSNTRYNSWHSSEVLGSEHLERSDRWKLLRRAKNFLARRNVDEKLFDQLNASFRERNAHLRGKDFPLLEYFSALKYSYSAPLPAKVIAKNRGENLDGRFIQTDYLDLCLPCGGASKRARVSDLVRSRSIRLDPVDSPKQIFLYRLRIRRCISWAYSVGLVPVMMTLTVFQRWHPLKGLLNVLKRAWNYFFTGTRMATRRAERMGLRGYIRRAEETINRGERRDDGSGGFNAGWHPHYHVILFVPRSKLDEVSSMEEELRDAWFQAVNRYFEKEFGKPIDASYEQSFRRHGLFFSRCFGAGARRVGGRFKPIFSHGLVGAKSSSGVVADFVCGSGADSICVASTGSEIEVMAPLRQVDDSEYLSKIFGCEASTLYGGDVEVASYGEKNSCIPFDLLCDDTAENNDLWVEYALATKGVRSFFFSFGLEGRVDEYFERYPERDPVKPYDKSRHVVAQLSREAYRFFYRRFKVDDLLKVAVQGYDALRKWCRRVYLDNGMLLSDITEDMLPQRPGSRLWYSNMGGRYSSSDDVVDISSIREDDICERNGQEISFETVAGGEEPVDSYTLEGFFPSAAGRLDYFPGDSS